MANTTDMTSNPWVMVTCTDCGQSFQKRALDTKYSNYCPGCQFDRMPPNPLR
jgi:Zn finger protein HypA/HybF involved in hydrogenase expression